MSCNLLLHTESYELVPLSSESSMETLMSVELLSLFSTERQSCCAAWTILCFPSSGDRTFTVGLQDTTDIHTHDQLPLPLIENLSIMYLHREMVRNFLIVHLLSETDKLTVSNIHIVNGLEYFGSHFVQLFQSVGPWLPVGLCNMTIYIVR